MVFLSPFSLYSGGKSFDAELTRGMLHHSQQTYLAHTGLGAACDGRHHWDVEQGGLLETPEN